MPGLFCFYLVSSIMPIMKFKFLKNLFLLALPVMAVTALFSFNQWYKKQNVLSKGSDANMSFDVNNFESRYFASFNDLKDYFQELAKEKGADYAFEVLKKADIPPNTDMHLLGHAVGDILYKQKGLDGIKICTEDFRNACSHSIVVGLFSDNGEGALPEIAQACRQAPGGSGAYTMCFHGLGHGILAAVGYDLPKAIGHCSAFGTREYGYQEKAQCNSGTIMEIIGGGGHDRELWAKQRVKLLSIKDPLSPCNTNLIPEDSKYLCYSYITPYIFEAVGADLGSPGPSDFEKAFKYCNKIPQSDKPNRDACFGGFGKEFIGLVRGRDIRKNSIANISNDNFKTVYEWCKLANNKDGTAACLLHAMDSLFWGGENDVNISLNFCSLFDDDPFYQGSCYRHLVGAVFFYIKDPQYINNFCQKLPAEHKDFCLSQIKQ